MSSPDRAKSATRDFSISHSKGLPLGKVPHFSFFKEVLIANNWSRHHSVFIYVADKEEAYDPTGQTSYMEACEMLQVVPVSYFLQHMQNSELAMMHQGLGPQVL